MLILAYRNLYDLEVRRGTWNITYFAWSHISVTQMWNGIGEPGYFINLMQVWVFLSFITCIQGN